MVYLLQLLPNSMLNLTPTEKQLMCDCVKGLKHPLFAPATCELTSTKGNARFPLQQVFLLFV